MKLTKQHLGLAAALLIVVGLFAFGLSVADGDSDFATYQRQGWLWAYLGAFGVGVVTSLTPCVYPMIPIVLGIFGARGKNVSRAKAFGLATLYVAGMGVTFAALGIIFAIIGQQWGTVLAEPAVVIPMVVLYVALAASMFGAFELNLPTSLQNKLNQVGGAGPGGAFAMGMVGGFTAAPCTGPFLMGLLGFITKTQSMALGGTLLFVYAMGIGVLFWVLAVFAVSLPKSGRWMDWMKSLGGIALLAAALYFLRPIVPALRDAGSPSTMFLLASLAVAAIGLAAGAVHLSFSDPRARLRKAVGVGLAVIGIFGVIAWVIVPSQKLPWQHAEEAAFADARASGKGVMVDFAATWCAPCAELEHTFADDEVYGALVADFVPLKFDVTKDSASNDALRERYGAKTLPAVLFIATDGSLLGRVNRFMPPAEFLKVLRPAARTIQDARAKREQRSMVDR